MNDAGIFDQVPLWLLIICIALGVLLAIELGYRLGRFRGLQPKHEVESPVGAMVGATLGLLAFILAFTFGLAANRFQERREMVVEEANSIGTTYLRAGLIPEPQSANVKTLLVEYVQVRLQAATGEGIDQAMQRSEEIHRGLWQEAELVGRANDKSIPVGLFIDSLNETIDLHAKRIQIGLRNRLPAPLWAALFLLSAFAMGGVGYHAGLFKSSRSPATMILVTSFAIIMGLIADLDRPTEGALRVSQEAMLKLEESMVEGSS